MAKDAYRKIKIAFIGGGSQMWAPTIIRDIVFKKGMEKTSFEFALLDTDMPRARAIKSLFDVKLAEWKVDRVSMFATTDDRKALSGADFVIIAITTGRLKAMRPDIEIPEKYSIYHTVGDTSGPGGWSRTLRNVPVFKDYAEKIKELAPNAYVLNYTNPMTPLTKILSDELGNQRVVGLCHGLFECYDMLKNVFGVKREEDVRIRFGGLNHFFWILDVIVNGRDGMQILKEKLASGSVDLDREAKADPMGWTSKKKLAAELFANYGYLPYLGDRHTCEFFNCYITSKEMMDRYGLVRTSIDDREKMYENAAENIRLWTAGKKGNDHDLTKKPSRETAADIIKAISFNEAFSDVVNLVNTGQIENLPRGAVVETMGYISGYGFSPMTTGPLPEPIKALLLPHAEVQLRTVAAALTGDLEEALLALAADPVCAHLTVGDVKKMGMELLQANKQYLPQFDLGV